MSESWDFSFLRHLYRDPWSAASLLQSGTYTAPPIRFFIFFQRFHTMIPLRASKYANSFDIVIRDTGFVHVRMCYSNISRAWPVA